MDSKQRIHVMTLANSIIGVSILAMPFCFKQCGIVLSIVLLLFSSILCRLACHFLLKSAIKARLRTFEFLAYHAFGSVGKLFVEIGMIGFLLGTCVAFFVVMGDLSPQIIAQVTEAKNIETLRTTILIALGLFCVLPLGLLRNVDSLSSVCIATILFYATLVFKIFLESAPQLFAANWYEHVAFWRPSGVLQCIPIFSMALFCQTQLFEIYQAIPNASLEKMNEVVKIAVNICTSVYIFVGVFGYIAVSRKPNLSGNILMDFEPSMVTETMKLGFVLSVAFSFPLIIFPCRASLYSLLYRPTYTGLHDSTNLYIPEGKFRFLTLIIVLVSLIIGILIPNIELVLGLVGSTIGIMICVIFPATCFICLTDKNTNERVLAQIMLVIGIGVMVLGTYANLYAIDHIEPVRNYDKLTSKGLGVSINIKDRHVNDNLSGNKIDVNLGILKNVGKIDKEMQIKIPDAVKEIRHEPVQPEEPVEVVENKAKEDFPKEVKVPKQDEETLQEPIVKLEEPKKEPTENKGSKPLVAVKDISTELNVNKKEPKEEVDIEAIRKEDQELAKGDNVKENLVAHEKLVREEKKLFEENKKILEEIKLQQAQQQVNVEKLKAVKNIQNIAQKAIETIVDDKLKDSETLQKVANENVAEIKNIVEQNDLKQEVLDPVAAAFAANVGNTNGKSEPLSYQLGLHENANVSKKTNIIKDLKDGEPKRNLSVLDLLGRSDRDEIKKALDAEILKKNLTEGRPKEAVGESKIQDGGETRKLTNDNDAKVKAEVKEEVKQDGADHKNDENLELRRDILSNDYNRK